MMLPTIHLNGTSRESLRKQISEAARAVATAMVALSDMAPHGRDYYPQGDSAYLMAVKEHKARAESLRSVYNELMMMVEHVMDAGNGR